jgi:hypothetical protein
MLIDGIKSRPQYPGLKADSYAKQHVFAADGDGAQAIIDLFSRQGGEINGSAIIVYAETDLGGADHVSRLGLLPTQMVHRLPTIATAMTRLSGVLQTSRMGTRIYAAGSETLIGLTVQLAQQFGMDPATVISEHRGTRARRVQCVHCKGMTENVTTNIVKCDHCGLNLLVRDHYSKRQAAFQGVCVDAEVPGDVPVVDEVFK